MQNVTHLIDGKHAGVVAIAPEAMVLDAIRLMAEHGIEATVANRSNYNQQSWRRFSYAQQREDRSPGNGGAEESRMHPNQFADEPDIAARSAGLLRSAFILDRRLP